MNLFARLLGDPSPDRTDDRPALTTPATDQHPRTTHSVADLDARSAALAGALIDAGARVEDRIVVQVDKSVDAVALYLACLRAGLVYVPVNVAYTANEIAFFVGDIGATALICRPDRETELTNAVGSTTTVLTLDGIGEGTLAERAATAEPHDAVIERDDTDTACVLYTSGTTGRSKGAMLSHGAIFANTAALHEVWGFTEGDVLLHTLPIFHVHGLFVALNTALLNGSEIIFCSRFDPDLIIDELANATVLMGVPTHYVRLLSHDGFDRQACAHMRLFTSGSAPMTEQTFHEFSERTGREIVERYGMSETLILSSNRLDGERVAGTVGFALPGVELRIGDDGGVEARLDAPFLGYWQLPDKTAESYTDDGWFRTGDVGTMDDEGRVTLAGRASDMIISGGYNVYPKEIELVIDEVDGVAESAVVGVPHPDFGEGVVAAVVLTDPDSVDPGAIEASIDAACTADLARFKHPKRVLFVDELPRNTMGKVQKKTLRTDHADLFTE